MKKLAIQPAPIAIDETGIIPEKDFVKQIRKYIPAALKIQILKEEYKLPGGGRIDMFGVSADKRLVIIECKKGKDKNLVDQIERYRNQFASNDPLLQKFLKEELGSEASTLNLSWNLRAIGIAPEFHSKAIEKCPSYIELIECTLFDNAAMFAWRKGKPPKPQTRKIGKPLPTVEKIMEEGSRKLKELGEELEKAIVDTGPGIDKYYAQRYIGFKIRDKRHFLAFAPVPSKGHFKLWLKLKHRRMPSLVTRDLSQLGRPAPGKFEIRIRDEKDIRAVKKRILLEAYEEASRRKPRNLL